MSDGKAHDKAILRVGIGLITLGGVAIAHHYPPQPIAAGLASFFAGGYYLSPDLDTPSRPWNRWGCLKIIWVPYQKLVPHRGISHTPILGTITRVLYLLLPAIALCLLTDSLSALGGLIGGDAIAIFAGLELSAWVHLWKDGLLR